LPPWGGSLQHFLDNLAGQESLGEGKGTWERGEEDNRKERMEKYGR